MTLPRSACYRGYPLAFPALILEEKQRFGRKEEETPTTTSEDNTPAVVASASGSRMSAPAITPRSLQATTARRSGPDGPETRRLTVGKGLSLAGEITSCDVLVVEGKVEAKLSDGKMLEITECGQFRGSVEIENADIAGRYDGQLVVHGRLTVRTTGRISGTVKYGELEVNAGGQIIGEIQVAGGGAQAQPGTPTFRSAAKFSSNTEEEGEETRRSDRKSA